MHREYVHDLEYLMQWNLFLLWLSLWGGTVAACFAVGLYVGYGEGKDRAERQYVDNVENSMYSEGIDTPT